MGDLVFGLTDGVPHGLKTGGVQGEEIGLGGGALERDFAREVDCRTGHVDVAVDARSAVVLGGEGAVFGDLGFEVLYWVQREELVEGGSAERAAVKGLNCGFGVDEWGNE